MTEEGGTLYVQTPPGVAETGFIQRIDVPLPTHEFGRPISWEAGYAPPPVFIGGTSLPGRDRVSLYGIRYNQNRRADLPPDEPKPKGYFVNYVVSEVASGSLAALHVLSQWMSSTYQCGQEVKDSVFASDLKKKERVALCLGREPQWKPSDAQWPLLAGSPMTFVDQFALPENEVTRQWLTFNEAVFLFWKEVNGKSVFKITTQAIKFQSAEDHYRAEARRLAKKKSIR